MRSVEEVDELIEAAATRLRELKAERELAVQERYGVRPGDVVIAQKGYGPERTHEEATVVSVDAHWRSKPWLTVRFRRKDGSWSLQDRNVYEHWEHQ